MALKKRRNTPTIKRQKLLHLLKQIHLGGILEECVLNIRKGIATINAVDITNSLIVSLKSTVASKEVKCELGIGNLELLIKFLSVIEDKRLNFNITENQLSISKEDKSRKLNYLLTQTDLISTNLDTDDDPKKKIVAMTEFSIELTEPLIKDLLIYLSIIENKDITLRFDDTEQLSFICGKANEHQFEIFVDGDVDGDGDDSDFEVIINGEHLSRVLAIIDFDEDEAPTLMFAKDVPIVIEDKNSFWALSSIVDEEGD